MINSNSQLKIESSSTFVNNLVEKLKNSDEESTETIALAAIKLLKEAIPHRDQIKYARFNINDLTSVEGLSETTKSDLCKLITQVFVGSRCPPPARQAFDQTIEARPYRSLPPFIQALSMADHLSEVQFNRLLHEEKLANAVSTVLQGRPPHPDIASVIALCDIFIQRNAEDSLTTLMELLFDEGDDPNDDFLRSTAALLTYDSSEEIWKENLLPILCAVGQIPPDERAEVLKLSLPFISKKDCSEKVIRDFYDTQLLVKGRVESAQDVLEAIYKIRTKEERADVIKMAIELLPVTETFVGADHVEIIKTISRISKEKRGFSLGCASLLLPWLKKPDELAKFLSEFSEFEGTIEKFEAAFKKAQALVKDLGMEKEVTFRDLCRWTYVLLNLPEDCLVETMRLTKTILGDEEEILENPGIYRFIAGLPAEERADVVGHVQKLIANEDIDPYWICGEGINLFNIILNTKKENRDLLVTNAKLFMRKNDVSHEKIRRINEIAGVDLIKLSKIGKSASALFASRDSYSFATLIVEFLAIPDTENVEEVAGYVTQMINEQDNLYNLSDIRTLVISIPPDQRADVFTKAKSLFQKDTTIESRKEIVKGLSSYSKEERPAVIEVAQFFDIGNLRGYPGPEAVFKTITDTPKGERADVLKHTKAFVGDESDANFKLKAWDAVGRLPKANRGGVVNTAKLISGKLTTNDISTVLFNIDAMEEEAKEAVTIVNEIIKDTISRSDYYVIFLTIRSIPKDWRADVLKAIQSTKVEDKVKFLTFIAKLPPKYYSESSFKIIVNFVNKFPGDKINYFLFVPPGFIVAINDTARTIPLLTKLAKKDPEYAANLLRSRGSEGNSVMHYPGAWEGSAELRKCVVVDWLDEEWLNDHGQHPCIHLSHEWFGAKKELTSQPIEMKTIEPEEYRRRAEKVRVTMEKFCDSLTNFQAYLEKEEKVAAAVAVRQDEVMRTMSYQGVVEVRTWAEIKARIRVMTDNLVEKKIWLGTHADVYQTEEEFRKLDEEYYEMLVQFETIIGKMHIAFLLDPVTKRRKEDKNRNPIPDMRYIASVITSLASATACAASHEAVIREKYNEAVGGIPITELNIVSQSANKNLYGIVEKYAEDYHGSDVHWKRAYRFVTGFEAIQDARNELTEININERRRRIIDSINNPLKFLKDTIDLIVENACDSHTKNREDAEKKTAELLRNNLLRQLTQANPSPEVKQLAEQLTSSNPEFSKYISTLKNVVNECQDLERKSAQAAKEMLASEKFTQSEQDTWIKEFEALQRFGFLGQFLEGTVPSTEREIQLQIFSRANINSTSVSRWLEKLSSVVGVANLKLEDAIDKYDIELTDIINRERPTLLAENKSVVNILKCVRNIERQIADKKLGPKERELVYKAKAAFEVGAKASLAKLRAHNEKNPDYQTAFSPERDLLPSKAFDRMVEGYYSEALHKCNLNQLALDAFQIEGIVVLNDDHLVSYE